LFKKIARAIAARGPRQSALPGALIIGAQKCGTTALAAYLAQHPRLMLSKEKELDFFGSDLRYAFGLSWYRDQWDSNRDRRAIRFEASPQYMFVPRAAMRIRQCLPGVRLIALVRDPVERAYSAWQMYRRQLSADMFFYRKLSSLRYADQGASWVLRSKEELDDFGLAVQRELMCLGHGLTMECSVVELGLYGPQLQAYLARFPREQLLVLDAAELRCNRTATLNRVLGHLDLPPWNWANADLSEAFVGGWTGDIPPHAAQSLRAYYAASNRLLDGVIDPLPAWAQSSHERAAA
jgi:hypothetical protein